MSELFAVDVGYDFIAAVADHVKDRLDQREEVTVLFPNRRAVRFLENRLSPVLLLHATVSSLEDYAREQVYTLSEAPPLFQQDIDRFLTLHDILRGRPQLYHRLGGTLERVFPWCRHLSDLFDEFDQQLLPSVAPIEYSDEVVGEAKVILQSLDSLYQDYRRVMESRNLTYRGDIFRRLQVVKERLEGTFVLAGFALLTKAQESLFRYLFRERETAVFFHTDLEGRHPVSDPYRIYADWMSGAFWGRRPVKIGDGNFPPRPAVTFHESFDTHAEADQLQQAVRGILSETGPLRAPLHTGVALPDPKSLFPVLYAIEGLSPENGTIPWNVTLGFPFERSVFFRLLDSLLELVLTRHETRGFYHASLLKLLSHPFMRTVKVGGTPLGETADRLRAAILSHNLAFLRPDDLKGLPELSARDLWSFQRLHDEILLPFASARTLHEAGRLLVRLIRGFQDALSEDEEAELERQLIQNFLDGVLPNLTHAESSRRDLSSPAVLCRVLKHLVAPLHIPFEGNPLEGIQVMGMLESRLLNFTHLFILDVNEGILPRRIKIDPLFPPSLNPLVGLPSVRTREALFRYTFFRLVDGSENVHIFFQNGVNGEEKRVRSRFVEQLLLEEEIRRAGKEKGASIKKLESELIETAAFAVPSMSRPPSKRPAFYGERLEALLARTVSPTILDDYLTCPHRFYLGRILKVAEETGVEESQSAPNVGKMVHEILHAAFSGTLGRPLRPDHLRRIREVALGEVGLAVRHGFPSLSPLRADLLIRLTEFRLNTLFSFMEGELEACPDLTVVEVEKSYRGHLGGYRLEGRIDRVDALREPPGGPVRWRIIDYKTGLSAKIPSPKLPEFLESFGFSDYSPEALAELRAVLNSVQLPMYLYLFRETHPVSTEESVEAVLFLLGKPKGELVSRPFTGETLSQERIAEVILYLLDHMRHSDTIAPYDVSHCQSCPFLKVCKFSHQTPGVTE